MTNKASLAEILRYLTGAVLIAPVVGGAIGFASALLFIMMTEGARSGEFDATLYLAWTLGLSFGVPAGLLCGLLASWPLRNMNPLRVITILSGFTLLFALPTIFLGPLSAVTGFIGFWVGFAFLLRRQRLTSPAAV